MVEEQLRGMHHKMWEAMSFTGAAAEEESASWRRDGAGEEWQRWKGVWWVKVGQQKLNSRQRRQISRGLQRLTAREHNEVTWLLKELTSEIRAEVAAQHSRSQSDEGRHEAAGAAGDDHDGTREVGTEWESDQSTSCFQPQRNRS